MAGPIRMPRRSDSAAAYAGPRKPLQALLNQIIDDGTQWAAAELEVSKLEAREILRGYAWLAALAFFGFALLMAGLIVLFQAVAFELGRYLESASGGGVLVGLALIGAAIAAWLAALRAPRSNGRVRSRIFRWLLEASPSTSPSNGGPGEQN